MCSFLAHGVNGVWPKRRTDLRKHHRQRGFEKHNQVPTVGCTADILDEGKEVRVELKMMV